MTVNEMIERLQDVAGEGYGDCELRLAFQPNWPLQFVIGGLAVPDAESRAMGDPAEKAGEQDDDDEEMPQAVYIVEGNHPRDDSPYAPSWVFPAAR